MPGASLALLSFCLTIPPMWREKRKLKDRRLACLQDIQALPEPIAKSEGFTFEEPTHLYI
ncbi:hypothetical protein SELR_pSRC400210 (plasmid) [Selenomonas ruminantium subsp. lactilytica TAM6421]|uniref:Uncharacterized protein n=1 Tax=Selenomonas ruminantium subsp. lactilytica (strain NBRC 103574 / TAM6421) TaxID=927704 RepID=I0GV85_SELRL|nr:hypothetical protein SELR_pSRC400210 [Selenomonas ruminantium subsp. lactilytica TAM6421]